MRRKKIIAGNWKMNTNWMEAMELAKNLRDHSRDIKEVEKIVFPSFPYLAGIQYILKNEHNFFVGAQNCSEHEKGAFTGEVSASMIRSTGVNYVLVGHSERRTYFKESAEQLIGKIKLALSQELKVVFCFGEQLAERKSGKHFETVKKQLNEVLLSFPKEKTSELVLAYEPVWAIGTGETASPQQAQEMHAFVRTCVTDIFSKDISDSISILYGGSCNAQNARELFACPDVDGGLIGGASLKAEEFCTIMKSF